MRKVFFLVLTTLGGVASLNAGKQFNGPRPVDIQWFYEALKQADTVDVLEGLPHQKWEYELRKVETDNQKTFDIDGELFYQKLLEVPAERKKQITDKFLGKIIFVPPTRIPVIKPCGGFHADYGLRWSKEGKVLASALLCFGCGEIHLIGDKFSVATDFSNEGQDYLSATVKPLRQSRPTISFDAARKLKPEMFKPEPTPKVEIKLQDRK